jgi:hypothetical protein
VTAKTSKMGENGGGDYHLLEIMEGKGKILDENGRDSTNWT